MDLNEMRKRWQEAVASRENIAVELTSSTTPLLRQISQLQELLQTKTSSWQNMETSLSERAFEAEMAVKENVKYITELETKFLNFQKQIEFLNATISQNVSHIKNLESQQIQLDNLNNCMKEQLRDFKSQLYFEIGQKQSFQTSLHELESRKNTEVEKVKEFFDECLAESNEKISHLQIEKDILFNELQLEKRKNGIFINQVLDCDRSKKCMIVVDFILNLMLIVK